MAFKNLEDRFNTKMRELYDHGSTKDGGPASGRNDEPFLEYKPYDPNARETAHDTRSLPVGSTKRDVQRLTKFMASNRGLLFLAKEQLLQTGNTFTETRILNPLFVVGNAVPYIHLSRGLSSPRDYAVKGELEYRSPVSDAVLGSAGRLQRETAAKAVSVVSGKSGSTGLLSLLSTSKLVSNLVGTFSVGKNGSLGINERPELNVNGEYYSVLLWKGFVKQSKQASALQSLQSNIRSGNITSAIASTKKVVSSILSGFKMQANTPLKAPTADDRGSTASDYTLAGRRYFIAGPKDTEGYLLKTLPPVPKAYTLQGDPVLPPFDYRSQIKLTTFAQKVELTNKVLTAAQTAKTQQVKKGISGFFSGLKDGFIKGFKQGTTQAFTATGKLPKSEQATANIGASVEDEVLRFPDLSIKARYNEDRMQELRDALKTQKANRFEYLNSLKPDANIGYVYGSLRPGEDAVVNPYANTKFTNGGYLQDKMNAQAIFDEESSAKSTSANTKNIIKQNGNDLIDVFFFDYVNKKTLPFRAYISNVAETITPEVSNTRYIGRIEQNIVYVGVSREVSFELKVHAMTDSEMDVIWERINYLTGLCYPATYLNGFMVPPFVKLTIGDIYVDQPGYFKAVSHQIDDKVSWEITPGRQAPHGISVRITFAIIEKRQMKTGSPFYPFTPQSFYT